MAFASTATLRQFLEQMRLQDLKRAMISFQRRMIVAACLSFTNCVLGAKCLDGGRIGEKCFGVSSIAICRIISFR